MKQITSFLQEARYWDQIYTSREGKKLQKIVYLILHFVQCSEAGQRGGVVGDDVGNLMCSFDQTALGDRVEGGIQTSSINDEIRVSM